MDYKYEDIAKMIDHSLLPPSLTDQELEYGCRMALEYDCASVCIMPYYLKRCAEILQGSTVKASTTIGFPHGGHTTAIKVAEAERALDDGCQELDMVTNISKVLSEDWEYVRQDLKAVIDVAHARNQKVKVIFENCYLKDTHKIRLCEICGEARSRLGEDLHRLRHVRSHARGRKTDARPLPCACPGEGGRGHSQSRPTPGLPRLGRIARGRLKDQRYSGGLPAVAGKVVMRINYEL